MHCAARSRSGRALQLCCPRSSLPQALCQWHVNPPLGEAVAKRPDEFFHQPSCIRTGCQVNLIIVPRAQHFSTALSKVERAVSNSGMKKFSQYEELNKPTNKNQPFYLVLITLLTRAAGATKTPSFCYSGLEEARLLSDFPKEL
ncbi:hypothetical protein UY3_04533 [Chelonia mydas]|uniref:Uncharacterized protein n=1 Tax=Chelonia mydas TaxID=8469 RepID=M7BM72_CHEMY|nr:hypothetical protein UY3_04533 [Chelonia mydas]